MLINMHNKQKKENEELKQKLSNLDKGYIN